MTAFGADNTGTTDARPGIQAALNSCDPTAGCDVYFPAGTYLLSTPPPGSSSVVTIPAGVPVTLEGAGSGSSVLQASGTGGPLSGYDILSASAATAGFSMHDLGVNFTTVPLGGAAVRIQSASTINLLNLRIQGAYDDIALGQVGATAGTTAYTNIRGVNASNAKHCFLRLDGGEQDTYVRNSYAQANALANSQIVCLPTNQVASAPGIQGLFVTNSSFLGFTRGFSFAANTGQIADLHLDNLYVDVAGNGPAFELFVPTGGTSIVQNVSVTNSTLQSSSTACVVHGPATAVNLRNVRCNGGIPSSLPSACGATAYARGFALVEITGIGTAGQTLTLTVTAPGGASHITIPVTTSGGEAPATIASAFGQLINASTLVTASCPLLVPAQAFSDISATDYSIGQDLELYSYSYGPSVTPTISVSSGSGSAHIALPNVSSTFAPGDSTYVGSPSAPHPSAISIAGSYAAMAQYGSGLHLQGGSSLLFSGDTLGDAANPNMYAVQIDGATTDYTAVIFRGDNLANASTASVHFVAGTGAGFNQAIQFTDNIGYNPTGPQTTTTGCNSSTINPFPFPAEVYVSGAFTNIQKNGATVYTGSPPAIQSAVVLLGAGESITINCPTGGMVPATSWFGE